MHMENWCYAVRSQRAHYRQRSHLAHLIDNYWRPPDQAVPKTQIFHQGCAHSLQASVFNVCLVSISIPIDAHSIRRCLQFSGQPSLI